MPKLSIILPTYNGERFLDEQFETILAQSDGDFEVLTVDDGSSDGTRDVVARFAARDRRVTIVSAAGNLGQNARLVELLGHARGDFVAIADQDDRWAPDRNARLFEAIGPRQMAFGRSDLIDAGGTRLGTSILETIGVDYQPGDRLLSLTQPMFSAHAMIVRRDRIGVEAFFAPLPFDWLIAIEAVLSDGLVYCDEAVVHHRQHADNQCNNFHNFKRSAGFSRSDLRYLLMFRMPERIKQWSVFDYLGRSRQVDRAWRKTFTSLAQDCQTVWFTEWRALRSNHAALRDHIVGALSPLAGSDTDLRRFERHIDVLTRPGLSRPVLGEVARRYRLLQSG